MSEETGQAPAPEAEAPYNPLTGRAPIHRKTPDEFAAELVRRSRQKAPEGEKPDDKAEPEASEVQETAPEEAETPPQQPVEAQGEQEGEAQAEAPESEEAAQAESEEGQAEQEAEQDPNQPAPKLADDDAVVDLDGEQVTISELRDGYLRRKDYTEKRMSESQARKEEASVNKRQFEQLLYSTQMAETTSVNVLAGVNQELSQFENIDWQRVQMDNPAAYEQLRQQQASLLTRQQQANAQYEQIKANTMRMVQEHKDRQAKETLDLMVDMFGGVNEWNRRYSQLRDVAATLEIPPAEFAEIRDRRLMIALHRMEQAESELETLKAVDTQKVNRPPKAPGVKRQSQAAASAESNRDRDAMGRFLKTGKPMDAAAIWQSKLEAEAAQHRKSRKH